MHTSPKTAPGQPPPGTTTTHASHNAIACAIHDNIYERNGGHHANKRINLRQGVLGCSCGCRNRPNDDLQRVRQGVVSRAHERGIARRVQCKGRAGQRGAGIPFRMKILLPSSMAEDLTYAGGVVLKNTMESGGPSHLRQSSTHAHSMQQHSARCNRARDQTAPNVAKHPGYHESTQSSDVISAINH